MGSTGNVTVIAVFIVFILVIGSVFGWITLPTAPTTIQPSGEVTPAEPFDWTFVYIGIAIFFGGAFFLSGLRVVRQTHRAVIETFGKYTRFMTSGLTWVFPVVQRLHALNITEQLVDVQKQDVITQENLNANVDAQVYYRIGEKEDELKNAFYNVDNVNQQMVQLAKSTLRAVIGKKAFKEVNSNRKELNDLIFETLEKETKSWGIKIVRVELKEITPPEDVQDTMNAIIKAENTKDAERDLAEAKKIEASGDKKARIERAEGLKRERVLIAEGDAEAIKKVADADKTRIELIAKGNAESIKLVNDSANKHFIENAKDLKALEVTEGSLQNNTKYIVTEKGISPNLIIDGGNGKEEGRKIIPYPYDRRKDKKKPETTS